MAKGAGSTHSLVNQPTGRRRRLLERCSAARGRTACSSSGFAPPRGCSHVQDASTTCPRHAPRRPRAVARLESYKPPRPLPKIFRLCKGDGTLNGGIFKGETINTPSMMCADDYAASLRCCGALTH